MIFPDITRGVEDAAHKKGFAVILCNTDENIEIEKTYIEALRLRLIDGFIFATMMPQSTHIQRLREAQIPIVLALRACGLDIDAVVIDNVQAAYSGTKYLIERGHTKIAFALGNTELALYRDRFRGYRQALEDAGLPFDESLVMHERNGVNGFYTLTKMMIEKGHIPDAVFATNDARAIISMRALYDMGFKIPGDISVLGFDNVAISAYVEPPLSTISQPLYNMGVLAAEKLICQIQYKEKNGVLEEPMIDTVEADIVIRKSTR
jgi:LacI family transcriptional regulator